MAKYELLIKPSAVKEIEDLPRKDRARVTRKPQQLANEPRPHGSEKLSAEEKYRVRQGNYRAVYSIDDELRVVLVVKVGTEKKCIANSHQGFIGFLIGGVARGMSSLSKFIC